MGEKLSGFFHRDGDPIRVKMPPIDGQRQLSASPPKNQPESQDRSPQSIADLPRRVANVTFFPFSSGGTLNEGIIPTTGQRVIFEGNQLRIVGKNPISTSTPLE